MTAPPARAASATAKDAEPSAGGGFASCMEQALDASAVREHDAATVETSDEPASDPAGHPEGTDPPGATPAATDLAALLPGWSAAPSAAAIAAAGAAAAGAASADALESAATVALDAVANKAQAPAAPAAPVAAGSAAVPQAALCSDEHHRAFPRPGADSAMAPPGTPAGPAQGAESREPRLLPPEASSVAVAAAHSGPPSPLPAAPRAVELAMPSAHLGPALASPAFAPALATQVRWWAQEGVQQAQLTLNPVEMGPVAVRIVVVDGREARIDFGADVAATRGAIEAALPVLAAALDEGGLKLAGGGVHDGAAQRQALWQQQQQQHQQQHAGRNVTAVTNGTAAGAAVDAATAAAVARPSPGRGLVDLVA
jgi:flagellar hook-length control protein FliK